MNPTDTNQLDATSDEAQLRELLHRRVDQDPHELDLAEGAVQRAGTIRRRRRAASGVLAIALVAASATAAWQVRGGHPRLDPAGRTPTSAMSRQLPTAAVSSTTPLPSDSGFSGAIPDCDAGNSVWRIAPVRGRTNQWSITVTAASSWCLAYGRPGASLRAADGSRLSTPIVASHSGAEPVVLRIGNNATALLTLPRSGCTGPVAASVQLRQRDAHRDIFLPLGVHTCPDKDRPWTVGNFTEAE